MPTQTENEDFQVPAKVGQVSRARNFSEHDAVYEPRACSHVSMAIGSCVVGSEQLCIDKRGPLEAGKAMHGFRRV